MEKYDLGSVWDEALIQEINLVWHKLHGWPDSPDGLSLLKKKYIIGTLSNGNARLLIDMAKFAGLPWDVIFSGDIIKSYKPNGRMYLGACEYLQLPPEKVGMVVQNFWIKLTSGRGASGRFEGSEKFRIEDDLCSEKGRRSRGNRRG